MPGYEAGGWQGLAAPKNTPREIVEALNKEVNAGLADAKFQYARKGPPMHCDAELARHAAVLVKRLLNRNARVQIGNKTVALSPEHIGMCGTHRVMNIMVPMIGLLTALPKTPLYDRLKREGRLTTLEDAHDNTRPDTNVIPMSMTYEAMVDGYIALYKNS